jgi:hypothetical protein
MDRASAAMVAACSFIRSSSSDNTFILSSL